MSRHLYAALIDEFCELTGIADSDAIAQGATVETNGIRFTLPYLEQANPDLLFIYADFANPPVDVEIDGYRALLKKNFSLYFNDGPVFVLSPDTGNVVLAQRERLDRLRADILADKLISLASTVHEWRQELFRAGDEQHHEPAKPRSKEQLSRRARAGK
jgi:hypothetical protein